MYMKPYRLLQSMTGAAMAIALMAGAQTPATSPATELAPAPAPAPLSTFVLTGPLQWLPPATFDVILNFYYLQRELWPVYKFALRPGGLLFIETLTLDMLQIHPETGLEYLLQPGELFDSFADMQILVYREGWQTGKNGHQRAVASLVARLVDKNAGT